MYSPLDFLASRLTHIYFKIWFNPCMSYILHSIYLLKFHHNEWCCCIHHTYVLPSRQQTAEHSLMRNVYLTKDYPPSSPRSIPWWGVFILPRTKTIVHRGTLDKREPPRNQKKFAEDNVLSKNIHRGVHANKYSPRSIKFPPRLLGGRKIFTEMLLTDCVGQGLFLKSA